MHILGDKEWKRTIIKESFGKCFWITSKASTVLREWIIIIMRCLWSSKCQSTKIVIHNWYMLTKCASIISIGQSIHWSTADIRMPFGPNELYTFYWCYFDFKHWLGMIWARFGSSLNNQSDNNHRSVRRSTIPCLPVCVRFFLWSLATSLNLRSVSQDTRWRSHFCARIHGSPFFFTWTRAMSVCFYFFFIYIAFCLSTQSIYHIYASVALQCESHTYAQ